jgi:ABC-type sulfate transport system substrate-binding protein
MKKYLRAVRAGTTWRPGALPQEIRKRSEGQRVSQTALSKRLAVLDSGARGSTTTLAKNGQGDVFISKDSE